eukprot:528275_1
MALFKRCTNLCQTLILKHSHTKSVFHSLSRSINTTLQENEMINDNNYDVKQIELMLNDECILVDQNDNIIGHASKKDCHLSSNELLHRAFSVLLFDSNNRLLMQQRANEKITFPNYWTNTCCSHPLYINEHCELNNINTNDLQIKINGIKNAAINRLNMELGIPINEINNINDFNFMTRILYKALCDDIKWTEHELDYILIIRKDVTLNLNENEVRDIKYCTPYDLNEMINDKQLLISPWFKLLYQSGLVNKWWQQLDDIVHKNYHTSHQIHSFLE